jgi:hypothetical protein
MQLTPPQLISASDLIVFVTAVLLSLGFFLVMRWFLKPSERESGGPEQQSRH